MPLSCTNLTYSAFDLVKNGISLLYSIWVHYQGYYSLKNIDVVEKKSMSDNECVHYSESVVKSKMGKIKNREKYCANTI